MAEDVESAENAVRCLLRHVGEDAPFPSSFLEGAKSVQLAEACYQSNKERRWIDLPALTV